MNELRLWRHRYSTILVRNYLCAICEESGRYKAFDDNATEILKVRLRVVTWRLQLRDHQESRLLQYPIARMSRNLNIEKRKCWWYGFFLLFEDRGPATSSHTPRSSINRRTVSTILSRGTEIFFGSRVACAVARNCSKRGEQSSWKSRCLDIIRYRKFQWNLDLSKNPILCRYAFRKYL